MGKSIAEKYGVTYHKEGDYYYPDLGLPEQESVDIGVYGRRHLKFIKEHRKVLYVQLLTQGKLPSYLAEINATAKERVWIMAKQIAEQNGVTESLKMDEPMKWVGLMNNAKHSAEEIVSAELIYA